MHTADPTAASGHGTTASAHHLVHATAGARAPDDPQGPAASTPTVTEVSRAFSDAVRNQVVEAHERASLQAQIGRLDAGERADLFREVVRTDHRDNTRYDSRSSDLLEFFNVLDAQNGAWQIPSGHVRHEMTRAFADAIARFATVEQRSEFIDEAAAEPGLAGRGDLARAIGTAVVSLDGIPRAVYEAMSSLYDPDSRNAPLKAVLDAGIEPRAVDPLTGARVDAPHAQLDELIEVVGRNLHQGRRAGEINDVWGEFHTANLFEAASRTALAAASRTPERDAAVDGTLGQLAEVINRDGGGLVNTLKDSFRSWDGGLETMFRAALVNGNDRAISAPLVALRAPLDALAGEIQAAHDAGDTARIEALRRTIADEPAIRALQYAGAELDGAILERVSDLGREWARSEAVWTGLARSAGHVLTYAAAQATGGPGAIGVGVATYVAYAAGGDVISGRYVAEGTAVESRKEMMEAVLTPLNKGLEGRPALDPGTQVAKYSPAWHALTDLKDAALDGSP